MFGARCWPRLVGSTGSCSAELAIHLTAQQRATYDAAQQLPALAEFSAEVEVLTARLSEEKRAKQIQKAKHTKAELDMKTVPEVIRMSLKDAKVPEAAKEAAAKVTSAVKDTKELASALKVKSNALLSADDFDGANECEKAANDVEGWIASAECPLCSPGE